MDGRSLERGRDDASLADMEIFKGGFRDVRDERKSAMEMNFIEDAGGQDALNLAWEGIPGAGGID
jgi:hypothetical protein